jgi:hypothetical protein
MRKLIVAIALVTTSVTLGGCFHHQQSVYAAPLPPPVAHPPLK